MWYYKKTLRGLSSLSPKNSLYGSFFYPLNFVGRVTMLAIIEKSQKTARESYFPAINCLSKARLTPF